MSTLDVIINKFNGSTITYSNILDFNNADIARPPLPLIPQGTIVKVIMNIKSGGHEQDQYLSKGSNTGAIYLHAEFIVLEGPFSRRRIFQNIGIAGNSQSGDDDVFGTIGRSLLRGLIESAKGVMPNDTSNAAIDARKINNFGDLNGLICTVKIGIEKDKSGKFDDRNTIICAITPDKKEYEIFMNNAIGNNNSWV